jgi:hypothetical protein
LLLHFGHVDFLLGRGLAIRSFQSATCIQRDTPLQGKSAMPKNSQMRPCHTTPSVIHTSYGNLNYGSNKSPDFGKRGAATKVPSGKSGKAKK